MLIKKTHKFLKYKFNGVPIVMALLSVLVVMYPELCYPQNGQDEDIEVVDISKDVITITEGLNIATQSSRIINIASHNVDIADTESELAMAALRPSVDANIGHTSLYNQPGALFNNNKVNTANKNSLFFGITVKHIIYDFGVNSYRYNESLVAIDKTKLDVHRVKNIIALNYLLACYELLETDRLIYVALREVEQLKAHRDVTQTLFNEGVITRNDFLAANVKLADANQRLLSLKNLRTLNASRINYFLTRPLMGEVTLVDNLPQPPVLAGLEVYWKLAQSQRMEVKMADKQIEILQIESKMKMATYYPKFFIQGGFNYTENRYLVHEGNWSVAIGADLNIFNGGATKSEVSKIKHKIAQQSEERKKIIDDIKLEVEKSYLDTKTALEKLKVTQAAIAQGHENLRINKARYEEGQGTATDILDAIALLAQAESNYYRALFELKRSYATLLYATATDVVLEYKR
ncbi:MAG: TolC family protein [Nitrospirae bacterium]|nr:TolC family protein [Nitrospirota bacterium]